MHPMELFRHTELRHILIATALISMCWAVNRWSVLPDRADLRKRRARWEIEAGKKPPDLGI